MEYEQLFSKGQYVDMSTNCPQFIQ